jgi:hypothetical protein
LKWVARRPILAKQRRGDANNGRLSWEDARRDARRWYNGLNVPRPPRGEQLDLRPYADRLPYEGKYREMVINALSRLLKTRKIDAILPEQ